MCYCKLKVACYTWQPLLPVEWGERPLEIVSSVTMAVRTLNKVTYMRICHSAEKSYYPTN